ncbi:MAG TPA: hypothetical protein VFA54_00050 [Bryobacterales bacterium]|jgi:hypothetical protein|nr:hypothetical protein [Bryobacterales bacterium]
MPKDADIVPEGAAAPSSAEKPPSQGSEAEEREIGDFITRQVLEKGSVFFDG